MDEQELVAVDMKIGRDRGEIGTGTPGRTMKRRHYAETKGKGISLKAFAKKLAKDGDETAKQWFLNKKGAANMKRSDANIKAAFEAAAATKLAKKPKANK